jgi:hypothetical protein
MFANFKKALIITVLLNVVFFCLWLIEVPALWFWVNHSDPKMKVFDHSPFVLEAQSNVSYTLMVATIDGEHPKPAFADIQAQVQWAEIGKSAALNFQRDEAWTEIARGLKGRGHIDAVSIGSFKPSVSGKVTVDISGWMGPTRVVTVDYGSSETLVILLTIISVNLLLTIWIVRKISRRFDRKPTGGVAPILEGGSVA